ncbi:MAG: hypothetical protein A3F68_05580 [Acidobacteria bacterium RIFCSPLOWO2_12_FULL_54_10]|nr:MAG: hypothetical protein A3F68_05580 [Acidobacteria bacterium RIFCSPLOWO2_12_FULL_54_10]
MSGSLLHEEINNPTAQLGREGEEAAYWYLRERGFSMVERNYRPQDSRGEIDLIGWEGETLVFIEVKTRGPDALRQPEAVVDRNKERVLSTAAREYRRRAHRLGSPHRFDIVSVIASDDGMHIEHFRDAFREGSRSE